IARQLLIDGVYSVIDEEHIKELETMVKLNDNDNSDPETPPPAGEET
ncbi:DUF1073 domain-containing protein, partial [Acinetobacter baumannii]|nr:DUF1073 domain-containing protein [Acinetobacter baumannii]